MTKYIAILRGINVGGKNKILMAGFRNILSKLGFSNVVSYIQSGNIILQSNKIKDTYKIAAIIKESISHNYGFDVPVIIRTAEELREIYNKNPYLKNYEIERLYLTFLDDVPLKTNIDSIDTAAYLPDKFEVNGKNIFGYYHGRVSDSKLTNNFYEKKLKITATTRNWKTVNKLIELSE